jgi:hypothetical protein
MVMYSSQYCAETFDMGLTWVRRASYLGLGVNLFYFSTDKKGMFLTTTYSTGIHVQTSKNDGQTFTVDSAQTLNQNVPILYWRDAWYAINGSTIVRSLSGYIRTEWELI